MMNIFLGFEQANRYVISKYVIVNCDLTSVELRIIANESGDTLGYIAEETTGFLTAFSRQMFRTHRPFRAVVMDTEGSPILWVRLCYLNASLKIYSWTID